MKAKDEQLGFGQKDRKRIWKNHTEIMDKENDWHQMTEANMVLENIEKIISEEMVVAIQAMKSVLDTRTWHGRKTERQLNHLGL